MSKKPGRGHNTRKPKAPRSKVRQYDDEESGSPRLKGTNKKVLKKPAKAVRGRGSSKKIKRFKRAGKESELLLDTHRVRSDLQLTEMAVRKGWNVQSKGKIRRRLMGILEKEEAEVVTKQGIVMLHSKADELAINSAKILVQMDNQDLIRTLKAKPDTTLPSTTVNVNVIQSLESNEGRNRVARFAQRFGVGSIISDGRSVEVTDIVRATGRVSAGQRDTEESDEVVPPKTTP